MIMKKLFLVLIAIPLLLISCTGDPGPPGPPGESGEDGVNILGQIFEVQVDFEANQDFSVFVDVPTSIEVFDTDIMVGYILTDVVDGIDVWEPLPQTLFFGDEILLYGFNFTVGDVELFLDGTVNFSDLGSDFTDDVVFRIAVLPADAAAAVDLNTLSMDDLMGSMNKQEIIKIK